MAKRGEALESPLNSLLRRGYRPVNAAAVGVKEVRQILDDAKDRLANAGLMWLPLIAIAVIGAWRYMDSLSQAKTDKQSYLRCLRQSQTWVRTVSNRASSSRPRGLPSTRSRLRSRMAGAVVG